MEGKAKPSKARTSASASRAKPKEYDTVPSLDRYLGRAMRRVTRTAMAEERGVAAETPISPFFLQVTTTPEAPLKGKGGMPLVTLPPGTVLFRGVRIPNMGAKEDARYFYRDFLGDPMPGQGVCMSPTHNAFFYPFPFVGFGAHEIGQTFQSMQAVVLVHPLTVVCNISPSQWVRGDAHQLTKPTDPYSRCTTFPYGCRELTEEELERRSYDNCLNPTFARRSGVRGWMAIAQLDALKSKKYDLKKETPPMLAYLKALEARFPGRGMEAMAWLYTDKNQNVGFPEIAVYPYKNHQGETTVRRILRTDREAVYYIEQEAAQDNLNYLPLAFFTQKGTVDMVKGLYDLRRIPMNADTFARPAKNYQPDVEGYVNSWLNDAMIHGIKLPFYGLSKLSFDTRTGFYVLPSLLPMNLRVPVPDAAIAVALGETGGAAASAPFTDIPYSYLMMPLDTPERRQLAMTYMLIFRTFFPEKFNQKFGLDKKVGVRRAMIFNRPPVLKTLFTELGLTMPKEWAAPLKRAGDQFKAEQQERSKPVQDAIDKAVAKVTSEHPLAILTKGPSFAEGGGATHARGIFSVVVPYSEGNGQVAFSRQIDSSTQFPMLETDTSYLVALKDSHLFNLAKEEMKTSPSYIFTCVEVYTAAPSDVRGKIEYYFSSIPKEKRHLIQTDKVSLYSVTAPSLADEQTKLILDTYTKLYPQTNSQVIRITDATSCVGGNTISFAKAGMFVDAFEISPQRARMLANNVLLADQEDFVNIYNGDYTKLYNFTDSDIVFIDPPWGGKSYRKEDSIDLFLGDMNVNDLIVKLVNGNTKLVAMKAPLNYNIDGLKKALADNGQILDSIKQDKMQLLFIAPVQENSSVGGARRSRFTRRVARVRRVRRGKTQKLNATAPFDYIRAFGAVWTRHALTKMA